ncbi:hypothetical protein [uncultured Desulfuromusa sp.]|uniref:hypothetical protein n=1 Tax=uncultured Desulfuromusa sp. TaxID=219183 RepID=UPI002AA87CAD|nr:hypothetical protein [uncultured Desulfuromusa sp.]
MQLFINNKKAGHFGEIFGGEALSKNPYFMLILTLLTIKIWLEQPAYPFSLAEGDVHDLSTRVDRFLIA